MFLHLSVSHSVHRGSASVHAGIPPPRSRHPSGADTPWEQTPPEQTHPSPPPPGSIHPPEQIPPLEQTHPPRAETATAADGTHPTGMHSCSFFNFWFLRTTFETLKCAFNEELFLLSKSIFRYQLCLK